MLVVCVRGRLPHTHRKGIIACGLLASNWCMTAAMISGTTYVPQGSFRRVYLPPHGVSQHAMVSPLTNTPNLVLASGMMGSSWCFGTARIS